MFITFEGIEGSGKTSVLNEAGKRLEERGVPVFMTREPGGSRFGAQIRTVLLHPENVPLAGEAELFLCLADRAQHVREHIRPALERGECVLCDRYCDSTLAYQGAGRGIDEAFIASCNRMASGGLLPEITFLFDLDPAVGLARAMRRNTQTGKEKTEGRFEAEELAFHERVREGFLRLARTSPERIVVVDASQDAARVIENVWSVLERACGRR